MFRFDLLEIELPDTYRCIYAVTHNNITLSKAWRCMDTWSYFKVRFVRQIKITNSMLNFKITSVCLCVYSQQDVNPRHTGRIDVTLVFPSYSLSQFYPCDLVHSVMSHVHVSYGYDHIYGGLTPSIHRPLQ